ncbi:MAG: hypothetical protein AB7S26_40800 [Sandaracinaceae bacterium]
MRWVAASIAVVLVACGSSPRAPRVVLRAEGRAVEERGGAIASAERPVSSAVDCPPVASSPEDAEAADALRAFFEANARGERPASPIGVLAPAEGSILLERARALGACPVRYEGARDLDDGILELDAPELGVLPVGRSWQRGRSGVTLHPAEDALVERRATRALTEWLDDHPVARVHRLRADYAELVAFLADAASTLCVAVDDPHDGPAPPLSCFAMEGRPGYVGVLSRVEPPYAEDEPDDATHSYRAFVDVDGTHYELGADGLSPIARVRARSGERWVGVGDASSGARAAQRSFAAVDAATVPTEAVRTASPRALGPWCIEGDGMLCCEVERRWRCADVRLARAITLIDAETVELRPGGALTFVEHDCDGGSELTECQVVRHLLHASDSSLEHDGSVRVGWSYDEHFGEWEGDARVVDGNARAVDWDYEVSMPPCIELRGATRRDTAYTARYPEHGRPRESRRERTSTPAYGARIESLPRVAPPRPELPGEEPEPDLRGAFRLAASGWERVDHCESH